MKIPRRREPSTKYVTVGNRKVPYFSRDEVVARGQISADKLVIGEVYWHIPGNELFIFKKISSVIEGELHLGRWRSWIIVAPEETFLYPVSDVECALLKDTIEKSRWWIGFSRRKHD